MTRYEYIHVDVFSRAPYGGNGLPVFLDAGALSSAQMLAMTVELRHFEAAFLSPTDSRTRWKVRIFDMHRELPFAGHPLLGAAVVLHRAFGAVTVCSWELELAGRTTSVTTAADGSWHSATMNQGTPTFVGTTPPTVDIADAFSLTLYDIRPDLPVQVVSTGLRYLVVPVRAGALGRAHVASDITSLVDSHGAEFAVLFDEASLEMRHWNNDGGQEDIATGSAAGAVGAYRLLHGLSRGGEAFDLNQGQFVGRPSRITVSAQGSAAEVGEVFVGGAVAHVGGGFLEVTP